MDGDPKIFLIVIGAVLVIAAGVRAMMGRDDREFDGFDRNPNRGFKSPGIFWFSVASGFALGVTAIGFAIFAL